MTREEFLSLSEKYLAGQCSAEEKELLNSYRDEMKLADDKWEDELGDKQEAHDRIWQHLAVSRRSLIPVTSAGRIAWLKAAAIVLVVLSAAFWFIKYRGQSGQQEALTRNDRTEVRPGGNKAYLTLADGSRIALNDVQDGELRAQGNIRISKAKNGTIVYHFSKTANSKLEAIVEYNTITTPRGGQYQIVLEDGSKVWLNAASSVRFPVAFTGRERKVELSGEAYFEVAKNKEKPFIVQANGTEVQVLGTHFNVSAYEEDESVIATLLEGSVRMVKGPAAVMLVPGQQGTSIKGKNGITLKTADIEATMSWKNGFFTFHDENIVNIMKEVSRWYDVEVEYRGDVKDREFGGTVSRYKEITELLHNMELTGAIHYKLEGRRLIIMK